jgi:hypothetical protein
VQYLALWLTAGDPASSPVLTLKWPALLACLPEN